MKSSLEPLHEAVAEQRPDGAKRREEAGERSETYVWLGAFSAFCAPIIYECNEYIIVNRVIYPYKETYSLALVALA
jgi:hypothetical protein